MLGRFPWRRFRGGAFRVRPPFFPFSLELVALPAFDVAEAPWAANMPAITSHGTRTRSAAMTIP